MPKSFLCDSCRFADVKVIEDWKPRFRGSFDTVLTHKMVTWCLKKYKIITKFSCDPKCGYKPRSGRIGKKLIQKEII